MVSKYYEKILQNIHEEFQWASNKLTTTAVNLKISFPLAFRRIRNRAEKNEEKM